MRELFKLVLLKNHAIKVPQLSTLYPVAEGLKSLIWSGYNNLPIKIIPRFVAELTKSILFHLMLNSSMTNDLSAFEIVTHEVY